MSQPDVQGMLAPPDSKGFDHPDIAAAARDIIGRAAAKKINELNPSAKKGRVVSVDFLNFKAQVWFPSDSQPVTVNLFSSTLPGLWDTKFPGSISTATQGAGSQVLVQKFFDSLYVTEILTGGQFASDWASAGTQTVAQTQTGPEYVRAADYTVRPVWTGDTTLPNAGGPYAINIGPFMRNATVDAQGDVNDKANPWDGIFEIEVASAIGSSKYRFGVSPFRQALTGGGNFGRGTPNGYGGSLDTWFRVLPECYENDFDANGGQINAHQYFADAGGAPFLWDWDNSADTQVTVTAVNTPVDSAIFAVASMKMQSNVSHATLKIAEGTATRYAVAPNAQYVVSTRLYATVTTADARVGIDWYDSAGALISSVFSTAATNLVATTWTSVFDFFVAPANAVTANAYIRIAGTPLTSTIFYCSIFQFLANDTASQSDYSIDVGMRQTIHGAPGLDPNFSNGEMWVRIYLHYIQQSASGSEEIPFVVRFRNLNSWNQPKSTKTGLVVFEYDVTPVEINGILGYTDGNNGWSTNTGGGTPLVPNAPASTGPWRNPDLLIGQRGVDVLSGGGLITNTSGSLKWATAFEIGGIGRSRRGLGRGKATISCPTSGTINVYPGTVYNGLTTVTCTANGIPMLPGQSLWWGIPPGVQSTAPPQKTYQNADPTLVGGLFLVDNTNSSGLWSPPEWAVLIAYMNAAGSQIKCNGQFVGGSVYIGDTNTASVTVGGNTINLGDSGSVINVNGAVNLANEVVGAVSITPVANTPTSTTVSYSALQGSGTISATVGANTTVIGSTVQGAAYSSPAGTSTLIWVYRTNNSSTSIGYRIYKGA